MHPPSPRARHPSHAARRSQREHKRAAWRQGARRMLPRPASSKAEFSYSSMCAAPPSPREKYEPSAPTDRRRRGLRLTSDFLSPHFCISVGGRIHPVATRARSSLGSAAEIAHIGTRVTLEHSTTDIGHRTAARRAGTPHGTDSYAALLRRNDKVHSITHDSIHLTSTIAAAS